MKSILLVAAVALASSTAQAVFVCPERPAVNDACRVISVFPLVCNNPKVNIAECNARQCTQAYVDNYAICQCRRSPEQFYEHSNNVQGLLRRCGIASLNNPYGSPFHYRPGQGTKLFLPTATANPPAVSGWTQVHHGTTYYGGHTTGIDGFTRIVSATAIVNGTTLVGGTTTWISSTPGVVSATSTGFVVATGTAAPLVGPTETPIPIEKKSKKLSGGAIAGIVLGCLAAIALACLLGWCWRKKRSQHTTVYNQHTYDAHHNTGPTRTVVTEKIEPVVVKTGSAAANYSHNLSNPGTTTYTTTTTTQGVPNNTNYSTSYNTASNAGYNAANAGYNAANNGYNTAVNNAYNSGRTFADGAQNAANNAAYGVSNAAHNTANAVNNGARAVGNAANNGARAVGNAANNAIH
ncbi:hypothetical protein BGZ94_006644 [Podila epigama]|nr:hypothetical protein BGZ94_006644 [Podila epigama]